jgi:hypothetical protein
VSLSIKDLWTVNHTCCVILSLCVELMLQKELSFSKSVPQVNVLSKVVALISFQTGHGTLGNVVGSDTMLQAERSRVRFPHWLFFFSLPNHLSRTMALR